MMKISAFDRAINTVGLDNAINVFRGLIKDPIACLMADDDTFYIHDFVKTVDGKAHHVTLSEAKSGVKVYQIACFSEDGLFALVVDDSCVINIQAEVVA